MNTKILHPEDLTTLPRPIVHSFCGKKEILTLNLRPESYTSEDGEERFRCTTLSVVNNGRLQPFEVIRLLHSNELFDGLSEAFMKAFAEAFSLTEYEVLAATLVRGLYSTAEELSAHRKALLGDREDLDALSAYVEQCKSYARSAFAE